MSKKQTRRLEVVKWGWTLLSHPDVSVLCSLPHPRQGVPPQDVQAAARHLAALQDPRRGERRLCRGARRRSVGPTGRAAARRRHDRAPVPR
jgi:hypothetical protein